MQQDNFDLSKLTGSVVIIPAAGTGKRFGGSQPKQYQILNGKKILDITLNIFLNCEKIEKILLIVSPEDKLFEELDSVLNEKIILIDGGEQRQISVNNGLRYLYDNGLPEHTPVLVHDAVRPCLSKRDLNELLDVYNKHHTACFLADPVADSLKKINQERQVKESVERENLVHALTPQLAAFIDLKNALSHVNKLGIIVTDEVSALTDCDIEVSAVFAQDLNPKITHKKDLELASQILIGRDQQTKND